jgi:hypothetical protein
MLERSSQGFDGKENSHAVGDSRARACPRLDGADERAELLFVEPGRAIA